QFFDDGNSDGAVGKRAFNFARPLWWAIGASAAIALGLFVWGQSSRHTDRADAAPLAMDSPPLATPRPKDSGPVGTEPSATAQAHEPVLPIDEKPEQPVATPNPTRTMGSPTKARAAKASSAPQPSASPAPQAGPPANAELDRAMSTRK